MWTRSFARDRVMARPGSDNVQRDLNGGNPMNIDGRITLCGRSNLLQGRFYDGRLVQLSIFDSALSPTAIQQLYRYNQVTFRLFASARPPSLSQLQPGLCVTVSH